MTLTTSLQWTSSFLKVSLRCHNCSSRSHFVELKVMSSPQIKSACQTAEWRSRKSVTLRTPQHCLPAIQAHAKRSSSRSQTSLEVAQRQRQTRKELETFQTQIGQKPSKLVKTETKSFSLTLYWKLKLATPCRTPVDSWRRVSKPMCQPSTSIKRPMAWLQRERTLRPPLTLLGASNSERTCHTS